MNIKEYAPVIIPTLNRFEHFKRCLDSLERCTGAKYTDVYVGLDYPPSEKYVDGWKKIDAYLKEKEVKNGFRNLFVRRRNHNCGIGKKGSNWDLLYLEINSLTDRFISTEDDNEFSPCFLEYMNQYLEYFKDDETITSVSGYSFPINYGCSADSVFKSYCYSPWGAGFWIKKRKKVKKEEWYSYVSNFHNVKCLLKRSPWLFVTLVSHYYSRRIYRDQVLRARNIINNTYTIAPAVSKVRNCGYDATGINCKSDNGLHANQEIDDKAYFSFVEPTEIVGLDKKYSKFFKQGTAAWIKTWIKYFLIRTHLVRRL